MYQNLVGALFSATHFSKYHLPLITTVCGNAQYGPGGERLWSESVTLVLDKGLRVQASEHIVTVVVASGTGCKGRLRSRTGAWRILFTPA